MCPPPMLTRLSVTLRLTLHHSLTPMQAFVQFADVPSAQRAKDAISGRMFAGNIVQAFHVPLHVYQAVQESA